jgi:hypothetical protein
MSLNEIQQQLHAPKGQYNTFGNYRYRSCEDILEAVKPLLGNATLTISDDVMEVGGRVYVRATATYREEGQEPVSVTAFAREAEARKGMDASQITGATSSYARKYALNGLFCIDDTKDADTLNAEPHEPTASTKPKKPAPKSKQEPKTERDELLEWMKGSAKLENQIYREALSVAGVKSAKELSVVDLRELKDTINAAIQERDMQTDAINERDNG